jgi:hypothetical protein
MVQRRRNQRATTGRNQVQNVRLVDKDEASDDMKVSSILNSLSVSNSQIRVQCGYTGTLGPAAQINGLIGFSELTGTDDWTSFSGQFTEFRVRAIQFRIFDVQPQSAATINIWATYHVQGGTVSGSFADIADRPDARTVVPGTGWTDLVWAAHGQPEMEFQSITNFNAFGGLVYNVSPASAISGTKYQIIAKYIVDFRGRT